MVYARRCRHRLSLVGFRWRRKQRCNWGAYRWTRSRDVIGVQTTLGESNSSTSRYESEKRELPTHGQENHLRFKLWPLESATDQRCQEEHLASLPRGDRKVATFPFFILCRMIVFAESNLHTAYLEIASKTGSEINNIRIEVHLTSKQFAHAAAIAEEIESLKKQVNDLLQGKEIAFQPESSPKTPPTRSVKKIATSTPVADNEARGTLTPAVVRILKRSRKPLRVANIYDALVAQGYTFTGKEPKKVLGIRLYKMSGVQVLGGGLFQAK